MKGEIRPAIKIERWHRRPSTHRYPMGYKALEIKAIIMIELTKTIGKHNHSQVYHLSDKATQQCINAILNLETGNIMEYRHLIADPSTREV